MPDRKQVLRKRVILIKAVRKKLAEREARRAATHSMPTPKLPRTSSKPVREQLQRLANYLLGKLKQLLAHAASAVVNALIYLVGAGGVVLILALVIGAAAAILGSPMGILFADESGDPNSIPIGEIVLEANTEFGETISDLVTNHPECSNVEFHYEYEDGHTWSSYWPEVLAVFAVNQNLNGDDDVIVIDREKAASLLENTRKQLSAFEEKILGLFLDGLAYCEIAETVGRPIKSVDNAVQRIRRKVARQLSSGDISNS